MLCVNSSRKETSSGLSIESVEPILPILLQQLKSQSSATDILGGGCFPLSVLAGAVPRINTGGWVSTPQEEYNRFLEGSPSILGG